MALFVNIHTKLSWISEPGRLIFPVSFCARVILRRSLFCDVRTAKRPTSLRAAIRRCVKFQPPSLKEKRNFSEPQNYDPKVSCSTNFELCTHRNFVLSHWSIPIGDWKPLESYLIRTFDNKRTQLPYQFVVGE